jgi:hypothetical protein
MNRVWKPYKRLFDEKVLQEFVVADISYLKQYLSMSEFDKGKDLLYMHSYILDDEHILPYIEEYAEDNDDEKLLELIQEREWLEIAEIILENSSYKKLAELIIRVVVPRAGTYGIPPQELPSWHYLSDPKIVKNDWCIHFTDDAENLAATGFKYLIDDITQLGLTTYFSKSYSNRSKNGYGFCFNLHTYKRYGRSNRNSKQPWKYGKEAVMFRASGVMCYHNGDEELQLIFKGDTVRDIIPIYASNDNKGFDFAIHNKQNDNTIYGNDDLEKVVDWVVTNYIQYRKII